MPKDKKTAGVLNAEEIKGIENRARKVCDNCGRPQFFDGGKCSICGK